jgi:rhodanese-related sulfurtransferase
MPMRSGKTKVAIDWASVLALKHGLPFRVLVVTHTPTTLGVWRNEIRKHCPIAYETFEGTLDNPVDINNSTSDRFGNSFRIKGCIQFLIVNVQSIYARDMHRDRSWDPTPREDIYAWRPQALILDEATCVGDPSSLQSKMLYRLQREVGIRFKLELTGTPNHRKILGVFGQFKILDDSVFGTALGAYKAQFCVFGGYLDKKLLKYRNIKPWRRKVEPHVFQMRRVPSRPPVHQVIPVELAPKTWALYDDMEKEAVVEIDGKTVMAPIVLTRLLKCAQIAAGWIKDEDGQWHRVGSELRDAFEDHVAQLKESRVKRLVVYCRHIPELRDAATVLKAQGYQTLLLHGGVPTLKREQKIANFHEPGGYKAFVAQIQTGSMGIDLSAADTAIYYTLTESLLHKDQADARILIHGDRKRTLTYYYFLPRGTVLETMYLALKTKMDLVEFVLKHKDIIHHEEVS